LTKEWADFAIQILRRKKKNSASSKAKTSHINEDFEKEEEKFSKFRKLKLHTLERVGGRLDQSP